MPRPLKPLKSNPELPSSVTSLQKPDWFKVRIQESDRYKKIEGLVTQHGLATVCREARCPNIYECWNAGTATFMLMGEVCTRACKFCHVKNGNPRQILDSEEPQKIKESVRTLDLNYVVLTSVNRDDLEDEGSSHFAEAVRQIKTLEKQVLVETLTPDFRKTQETSVQRMIESGVDVIAHNVETIRRLVPWVRDGRCNHDLSLRFHQTAKKIKPSVITKSSIMVGLGETQDEVVETFKELRDANVDVVTVGQYLQPTKNHHPVIRYVHPDEFKFYEETGMKMGFRFIASGPMVRSSYRAAEVFIQGMILKEQKGKSHVHIQTA